MGSTIMGRVLQNFMYLHNDSFKSLDVRGSKVSYNVSFKSLLFLSFYIVSMQRKMADNEFT